MKDTLIVNLYGGPGSGKSTGAAYIFSMLKMVGVDAEYVTEFAKDKVWEGNQEVFKCQFLHHRETGVPYRTVLWEGRCNRY